MSDGRPPPLASVLAVPGALRVLAHLRRARVDYGVSIAISTGIPLEDVLGVLDKLESMGLIRRVPGSSVKRSEAKLKLSDEVHRHHMYYELSDAGDLLLRSLDWDSFVEGCRLALRDDPLAVKILEAARRIGVDNALTYAKLVGRPLEEVESELERLVGMGLMEVSRSRIIKRHERRAKPKAETRVHHRYYKLSDAGEALLRRMGDRQGLKRDPPMSGR
ncbi:MAG: DUF2250 domain-containing protein [Nitrososphaeria archaeon]